MRISDWSSDVCSSDLAGGAAPRLPGGTDDGGPHAAGGTGTPHLDRRRETLSARSLSWGRAAERAAGPDRKSVVKGKSVSGRVDLGGRRILKKKKIDKIRIKHRTQQ